MIKQKICLAVLLSVFAASPTLLAQAKSAESLSPFQAQYTVKSAGLKLAYTEFNLSQQQDGAYVYRSSAKAAGMAGLFKDARAYERSRLTTHAGDIVPLEYRYQLKNGDESKDYKSVFDWSRNKVKVRNQDSMTTITVPDGTLDRFVLQLAVMLDLKQGRSKLEYSVLDKLKLKNYEFKIQGTEWVKTPAGNFEAVKIQSVRKSSGDERITTFWCAPKLQYLPVRITYKSPRKPRYTMSLRRHSGLKH